MALVTAGAAGAQPPPPDPCSPAAVMRVHAAAMTRMADYLDSRPDVQQVFRDARSKGSMQERHDAIKSYTDTHPDVAAAFQNIHQPVRDLSTMCGLPMHDGMMSQGMGGGDMAPGGMRSGEMAPPGGMAPSGMGSAGMGHGSMAPPQ
ncbi:hemophore-related protein [Mycobacterium sp. 852014-52144_SCH5372336]|uniref:hemophore-related protein n=1 Tax=Mycobacterium sp. 852014-52144_SCH5372336 TaxID=1834115 RepID=UPI001E3FD953|nr:hemophore-related protein [Mycobacterium sp. 852014-52144_SCH5372336]